MNRFFFLLLLLSGLSQTSFAQFPPMGGGSNDRPAAIPGTATDTSPKGNGKIAGIVMDSTTNLPVEFATIALVNKATGRPVDGTSADDKGRFSLSRVPAGEFMLQVVFLGYRKLTLPAVTIERGSDINVGMVRLAPDVKTLGEVTVVGQTALIEEKVDRLVYNADKDIAAKGGDATDIMRKVPMLSVDLDGNVSLRGSSNVRVLINNKPSTIVASSVADALKQIPADQIKSIEVITSPSAKYDAEGSAGIINIVTKKNNLQGTTLNVDLGQGNRGTSLNLNGSYRTGKMGFSLGGFGRAEYNVRGAFNNTQQTFDFNPTTGNRTLKATTVQSANTLTERLFGNYQLGWDYDIDKNTSLTASIRYGARNGNAYQNNLLARTTFANAGGPISTNRDVNTIDKNGTLDASVTYTKTYKPNKELSVLALYSRNDRTNNFVADLLNGVDDQTITSRQRNLNPSNNQESTLQVDYQTPLKTNQLLEFGGKGIMRQVNSDFQYQIAAGANGEYVTDRNRPANGLDYSQQIAASYLSYTLTTKNKYTIKAGARYEYTFIDARFRTETRNTLGGIPNYGNLVPSVNISRNLKGGKSIKLAYNRRIQRPGIQFLNPNVNAANPLNTSQGDPTLSPELTDNVELALSGQVKVVYLNATLFARQTNSEITAVRNVLPGAAGAPDTIQSTFRNIGQENAVGLNLFTNTTLFSRWQIGGGVDVYHVNLTNNVSDPLYRATNAGWVVMGRLFTTLTIKNGWAVQGFGGMRGKQVQLQGYQGSFGFYSLGVRKEFNEKRGTIGLSGENFFNFPFKVNSQFDSPVLAQSSVNSFYNAGFRVNFSYRIGKMSFDAPARRKKSVNNDDVVGGEGGGEQQQPAQPAQGGGGGGRPR
jgi:iron complex outermembrane recepter protein